MKNIYLYVLGLIFPFAATVFGQVEIYNGINSNVNIAGEVVEVTLYGQEAEGNFYFKNTSDRTMTYKVSRVQITAVNFMLREQLCVGGPSGLGNCYILETDQEVYEFPTPVSLQIGEKGNIEYIFDNYDIPADVHNRYFVMDDLGSKIDSVDVKATATLGVNSPANTNVAVSVATYPNPVSDYLNVKVTGSEENQVRIIDVLGNVVYDGKMNASKKIDVNNLNNGVYIIKVSNANGKELQSKKLIIRH